MSTTGQKVSYSQFGELSHFRSVQAAEATGPTPFGDPSRVFGVLARSSCQAAQVARFSEDERL